MKHTDRRYQTPSRPPRLGHQSAPANGSNLASGISNAAHAGGPGYLRRMAAVLRWPFTSRLASPIWLAVRLYLGWFWFQMGLVKVQGGWLTTNPLEPLFQGIAAGHTAAPFEAYRGVIQLLLDLGMAPVMSVTFPFLEMAAGLAFLSGVLVVPAAVGATLLNVNLILSGIAHLSFDGKFIALQLLLILAWRVSSTIGIQSLLVRGLRAARQALYPTRVAPSLAS